MRNLGYTIKYAIQRILLMLLTLLIITLICFVLIQIMYTVSVIPVNTEVFCCRF